MVVLVCGGRNYKDKHTLDQVMSTLHSVTPITRVVTGGALGADMLGYKWAVANKIANPVYPADWEFYGRAAGHIRNQLMLDSEDVQLVIAFPGGTGTADMINRAKRKGIKVHQVDG